MHKCLYFEYPFVFLGRINYYYENCQTVSFIVQFFLLYLLVGLLNLKNSLFIYELIDELIMNYWYLAMNSMKRQKDRTLKDELPRLVGAQYATGDQWINNSRKNEEMKPKQKQHPVVDVTGDGSKVWCCKEQYCIVTWNVRSMNQGKLEVVNRRWQEWTSTF